MGIIRAELIFAISDSLFNSRKLIIANDAAVALETVLVRTIIVH